MPYPRCGASPTVSGPPRGDARGDVLADARRSSSAGLQELHGLPSRRTRTGLQPDLPHRHSEPSVAGRVRRSPLARFALRSRLPARTPCCGSRSLGGLDLLRLRTSTERCSRSCRFRGIWIHLYGYELGKGCSRRAGLRCASVDPDGLRVCLLVNSRCVLEQLVDDGRLAAGDLHVRCGQRPPVNAGRSQQSLRSELTKRLAWALCGFDVERWVTVVGEVVDGYQVRSGDLSGDLLSRRRSLERVAADALVRELVVGGHREHSAVAVRAAVEKAVGRHRVEERLRAEIRPLVREESRRLAEGWTAPEFETALQRSAHDALRTLVRRAPASDLSVEAVAPDLRTAMSAERQRLEAKVARLVQEHIRLAEVTGEAPDSNSLTDLRGAAEAALEDAARHYVLRYPHGSWRTTFAPVAISRIRRQLRARGWYVESTLWDGVAAANIGTHTRRGRNAAAEIADRRELRRADGGADRRLRLAGPPRGQVVARRAQR